MLQLDADAVGNLEAALLAQVLDALYEFAGIAFVAELVGDGDVEGYGQGAVVGNRPAGDILAEDFHILQLHGDGIACGQGQRQLASLKNGNLLLCEGYDGCVDVLHQLAELLAHRAEVALHFLHQHALGIHELHLLHVHLVQYELLHRQQTLLLLGVDGGNGDAG